MLTLYWHLAPVVRKVDIAIHRINHYPVACVQPPPPPLKKNHFLEGRGGCTQTTIQWIAQLLSLIFIRWIVIYPGG